MKFDLFEPWPISPSIVVSEARHREEKCAKPMRRRVNFLPVGSGWVAGGAWRSRVMSASSLVIDGALPAWGGAS